jgi:MFS family permease
VRKEARAGGWRDFTILWSASAASQLGSMCAATANPLLALLLTHSPVVAGWVGAASTIPALLTYLPAGWLVDHVSRRKLMFISQIGRLASCLLLLCALHSGHHSISVLLVTGVCEGAFFVLYGAAEVTVIQRVVDAEELSSALAMNEARTHLTLVAGKPLGGFLFGAGKAFPYWANLFVSICSVFALLKMKERNYGPHRTDRAADPGDRHRAPILSGVETVVRSSFLRTVIVVCTVGNFCFQTLVLLLVVLAQEQHMSSARIGLLLASSGVGGLIGSIAAPRLARRARDERAIIKLCVLAWAALTFVVAVSAFFAQPTIGLIAWGGLSVTGAFLNVAIITYQTRCVSDDMLGRVTGINRFLTSGAVPLGALSAGYLVAELRPHVAAALVCCTITSLACLVWLRPRKRLVAVVAWMKPQEPALPSVSSDLDRFAAARGTSR